ncbi:ImpE protein [Pseudovibrio axinellae]|uniref:ImpE protein n=2 Tax=Pseudovibrio axinellae TaxID=989403 RepID=A0A165UMV7_9HYPH|nr:ImpE protein [Pseudovibrio axinellae]SEP65954.1 type VI secretion system protein ImpE [Pseudovibrio axinellae]
MHAKEHLATGNLKEALESTQETVREHPEDVKERILLFQLYCINGDWLKAKKQLPVIRQFDVSAIPMVETYSRLIDMEQFREEVFSSDKTPLLFGEPKEWLSYLIQALKFDVKKNNQAATELREQAFEEAEAISGAINGETFEWLADADPRLGPVLELMMSNAYYWVPFSAIKSIRIPEPRDLRDMCWTPVNLLWVNGGPANGFIPTRYVETVLADDANLKLSRLTTWVDEKPVGQRMFVSEATEVSLQEIRSVNFDSALDIHKELGPIHSGDDGPSSRKPDHG